MAEQTRPPGVKPALLRALRGPEGPLFHGKAIVRAALPQRRFFHRGGFHGNTSIRGFFRSLLGCGGCGCQGFVQQAAGLGDEFGDFEGFHEAGNIVFLQESAAFSLVDPG